MKSWRAAVLVRSAFIFSAFSWGQAFRGSIIGHVKDASGGRILRATIVVHARASALERTVTSDNNGDFRVDDLPSGSYHVSVTAPGFAEAGSDLEVVVSMVREITATLQPAAIQQSVKVQGHASSISTEQIDLSSAVHQGAVSAEGLQTIPLAHRSFANIAFLVPGTEPVEPSDPTKARITAVSFGGSSGLNVELSGDGGDDSDDYIGVFLQNYSPDVVQEFVVRTSQEDADTGRTTGGSVVLTTKRGTDDWHGETAIYERAAARNARLPIDNPPPEPKQPFSRQNYIGTLGGRVVKGRIWFFSSLEYVHEDASIAYSPASISQFKTLATLASAGLVLEVNSIAVPENAPVPVSRLPGDHTLRLDAIRPLAVVPARRRGSLHHHQRSRAASHSAVHRSDVTLELHEPAAEPTIHLQPHVSGLVRRRSQRPAPHRDAQRRSRICPRVSIQLDGQLHLRLRNLWRQSIRHTHHQFPGSAQSGKISIPL